MCASTPPNLLDALLESVDIGVRQHTAAVQTAREKTRLDERVRQQLRVSGSVSGSDWPNDGDSDGDAGVDRHRDWREGRGKRRRTAAPVATAQMNERVLVAWHEQRRYEYGMTTIDDSHLCSLAMCADTGSIQCISHQLRLYGCVNSGRHHVCRADRDCLQRYNTFNGGIYCIFSSGFIEAYIDTTFYGSTVDEREVYINSVEFSTSSCAGLKEARKRRRDTVRAERLAAAALAKAGALGPLDAPARVRFGMEIQGKPRDMALVAEAVNVSARALEGNCGGDDAYLDGFVAINGTDEVDNTAVCYRAGPALLTDGRAASVAEAEAAAHSRAKALQMYGSSSGATAGGLAPLTFAERRAAGAAQKPPPDYFTRHTRHDIERIVCALFDRPSRERLRARQAGNVRAAAFDAIAGYYVACSDAGVRPSAGQCDAIYQDIAARVPQVTAAVLDDARRVRYTAFLYELWRVVIATPFFRTNRTEFHLVSHTLGALYMMCHVIALASRDGTVVATVLTEPDGFLCENLPPPVLLREWEARAVVHSAARVVAVKGAPGGSVSFSMKLSSHGRNAIKAALLSIETDFERVAISERLRRAYVNGTVERDDEIYFR